MSQEIIIGIIVALAFGGFIAYLLYSKKKKKREEAWHVPTESRAQRIIDSQPSVAVTAIRSMVYEQGLPHRPSLADAMQAGLERAFRNGECEGYPYEPDRFPVKCVVFKSELSLSGHPSFRVPIFPQDYAYWNSEYDKMKGVDSIPHYVLAAGQMIAGGEPDGFIFVAPYMDDSFLDYFADVSENECQHHVLFVYDGEKFEATKYHQNGQGHPLYAGCDGQPLFKHPEITASSGADFGSKGCILLVK